MKRNSLRIHNKPLTVRKNYYIVGGNLHTGIGDTMQGLSGAVSAVNPLIGAAVNVAGGLVNNLFGSSINSENVASFKSQNEAQANRTFDASNTNDLLNLSNFGLLSNISKSDVGSEGLFSNKVSKLTNRLNAERNQANTDAQNSYALAVNNLNRNTGMNLLYNTKSFGGELGTNGANFSNGIIEINEGGTHEQNPNEGVLFGMDQQGVPNLVEEGEVVYNDYVFSNRIKVPKDIKEKHKLKGDLTFADAVKKLSKESEERPNDPISNNGLEYLMNDLIQTQEMIKAKRNKNKFKNGGLVNKYPDGTSNLDISDLNLNTKAIVNNTLKPLPTSNRTWGDLFQPSTNKNKKWWQNVLQTPNLRYIPTLGAAIGSITDLAGLTNNPNYEPSDMILEASDNIGKEAPIEYKPIGNYVDYKPFDSDYYTNKLNAESSAARRNIINTSGGNRATSTAGILAADYNAQNQLGELARQTEEQNFNRRMQVENFNRATNQYNSESALKADIANAENRMRNRQLRLNAVTTAAQMRQQAQEAADAAKSVNLTNLFDSLGDIGREEYMLNLINNNPALYYALSHLGDINYKKSKGGFLTIKNKKRWR